MKTLVYRVFYTSLKYILKVISKFQNTSGLILLFWKGEKQKTFIDLLVKKCEFFMFLETNEIDSRIISCSFVTFICLKAALHENNLI